MDLRLNGKTAVVFGGSGAIGGAAARAFVREGAKVLLIARGEARLKALAERLQAQGGDAQHFTADVLDAENTTLLMQDLAKRFGEFSVVVNATSFMHDQGSNIDALDVDAFMQPLTTFLPALFNATKAVLPHMAKGDQSTIFTLSTPAGRTATAGHLGYSATCAGIEAFTRVLAAELGPRNIRVVCVAPHAIADAPQNGSYTRELFAAKASAIGMSVEDWLAAAAGGTMLGELPTLEEVADALVFLASDRAKSVTSSYFNISGGSVSD